MGVDGFTSLISTVGFPIACCIVLAYFIYKVVERYANEGRDREKTLNETVTKNEVVLSRLTDNLAKATETNQTLAEVSKDMLHQVNDKLDNINNKIDSLSK